nr:uncharacterized protein LOC128693138 [Cherax quadricarinatus]
MADYSVTSLAAVGSSPDECKVSLVEDPVLHAHPGSPLEAPLLVPLDDEFLQVPAPPEKFLDKTTSEESEGPLLGVEEPPRMRTRRLAKQVLMFLCVSVSHIPQLGMTLTWPNALASHIHHDNTTIYGSSLHLHDWQMDMMGSLLPYDERGGELWTTTQELDIVYPTVVGDADITTVMIGESSRLHVLGGYDGINREAMPVSGNEVKGIGLGLWDKV